jgi:methyl-accepting chemotaxis protein
MRRLLNFFTIDDSTSTSMMLSEAKPNKAPARIAPTPSAVQETQSAIQSPVKSPVNPVATANQFADSSDEWEEF